MATILDLSREGGPLRWIDPQLEPHEQEWRRIYGAGRFVEWFEQQLPSLTSDWKVEDSPLEQFDQLLETYCSGATLTFQHRFKCLYPRDKCVWELKTADLRIFGWFPKMDHFIAVVADTAQRVKLHSLVHGYVGEVERFREKLDLDPPKYLVGEDPNVVVTNFDHP